MAPSENDSYDYGGALLRERRKVLHYMARILHSSAAPEDAEDICSVAQLATAEWVYSRERPPDSTDVIRYFYGCARNAAREWNRTRARRQRIEKKGHADIIKINYPSSDLQEEDIERIRDLMDAANLADDSREVIEKRLDGWSYEDIADGADKSEVAIRQIHSRAVRAMRRAALPLFAIVLVGAVAAIVLERTLPRFARDEHSWRLRTGLFTWATITPEAKNGYVIAPKSVRFEHWRHIDLDGDGEKETVVFSLDSERPDDSLGAMRIDCLSSNGAIKWTRFLDEDVRFKDGESYSGSEFAIEDVLFADWSGDGRPEIMVVGTHLYFPSTLSMLDRHGEIIFEYVNVGHIKHMVPIPLEYHNTLATNTSLRLEKREAGTALALSVFFQESKTSGLVYLSPMAESGTSPANDPRYTIDDSGVASDAVFLRMPPSAIAARLPAGHNWPGNIECESHASRIRVATIEIPEDFVVLHYFDSALRKSAVVATDRFANEHRRRILAEETIPGLEDAEFIRSVETVEIWENGAWRSRRHHGTWGGLDTPLP